MCAKTATLEAGHIVPAFVWRWLIKTAALPYVRTAEEPNRRLQDGWKRHWLCRACEDQIGRFEKAFSEELFPLVVTEKKAPYGYGPWLSRFIASIAWRTLLLYSERGESFEFLRPEHRALVPQALERWRAFVLGEADTPGVHELHFISLGVLADYQGDRILPPNFNRYLLRTIELHITGGPSQALVYIKMGSAVAVGFIQPPPPDDWVGTRVALGEGQVGGSITVPIQFLDYLIERAEKVRGSMQDRSPRQREKIQKELLANPDRAASSETMRAMQADVERFGIKRVFRPS
jgi:hypothetical protein